MRPRVGGGRLSSQCAVRKDYVKAFETTELARQYLLRQHSLRQQMNRFYQVGAPRADLKKLPEVLEQQMLISVSSQNNPAKALMFQ